MLNLRLRLIFFAISLCKAGVSLNRELQIESFELQVFHQRSSLIENYDLIKVNSLTLETNTRFHFKCLASGEPLEYVAIKSKYSYKRNDTKHNFISASIDYIIDTVDCRHSSDYTCQAGNMAGLKQKTTIIIIKCPVSEAKFSFNKKNYHVSVSNPQKDMTMTCEDNDRPNSLTLYNQRNRSHRLNYTESNTRVTYTMSSVTCEDMGTYICVVNKSIPQQLGHDHQDLYNGTEVQLDVSVNNCPPRLCHEKIKDMLITREYGMIMSIKICVEVSIGTRVFGVFYIGKWVTNGTCKEGMCLDCKKHDGSQFKHNLNITCSNIDKRQLNDIIIYIGSGYNYKNNYMNYTIRFKHDDTLDTTHDILIAWIRGLIMLCVLLLCSTLSLFVVLYNYKKRTKIATKYPVTVTSSYSTNQQLDVENAYESMNHSSQTEAEGNFQDQNSISASENILTHFYVNCDRHVLEAGDPVRLNWMQRCWKIITCD